MRIAFICKRHYTGKDVINDKYGRLYEWPRQLSKLGHSIKAWCIDYHGVLNENQIQNENQNTIEWTSFAVGSYKKAKFIKYPAYLHKQLIDFQPDLIVGASDIPHIALTKWLAGKMATPFVIDLYDNFESFGQAKIPGFKKLLANAITNANLVITVSDTLRNKIIGEHAIACPILTMPNGIDQSVFFQESQALARKKLGLPSNVKLVGTAGSLSRMKGIEVVYESWQEIQDIHPNVHLVLAGPIEIGLPPPDGARVHYLGKLKETQVATLFCALDVGIIPLSDSNFGKYCFPQKLNEMQACKLPFVVANIGEMRTLFSSWPRIVFSPNNARSLVLAITKQIEEPCIPDIPTLDWKTLFEKIEPRLKEIVYSHRIQKNNYSEYLN